MNGFSRSKEGTSGVDQRSSPRPKIIGRTTDIVSPWIKLVAKEVDFGFGANQTYHAFAQEDYVSILPLTSEGNIVLVRQYRPAIEEFTLEFPGGTVEPGEKIIDAAVRELEEETGYRAQETHQLASLAPDVGRLTNRLHCFIAVDVQAPAGDWIPEVGVEVIVVSISRLLELAKQGAIQNCGHVALLGQVVLEGYIRLGNDGEN